MTRINAGIPPQKLMDWHLIAEINEMPRLNELYKRIKNFNDIPKWFTLGKGHLKFFMDKGEYLKRRYNLLLKEEASRKLKLPDDVKSEIVKNRFCQNQYFLFNQEHMNDYTPQQRDKEIMVHRLVTRIIDSDHYPWYYGERISKGKACSILMEIAEPVKHDDNENQLDIFKPK